MDNNLHDANIKKAFNERNLRANYNNRCISDIANNNKKLVDAQNLGRDIILEQR